MLMIYGIGHVPGTVTDSTERKHEGGNGSWIQIRCDVKKRALELVGYEALAYMCKMLGMQTLCVPWLAIKRIHRIVREVELGVVNPRSSGVRGLSSHKNASYSPRIGVASHRAAGGVNHGTLKRGNGIPTLKKDI